MLLVIRGCCSRRALEFTLIFRETISLLFRLDDDDDELWYAFRIFFTKFILDATCDEFDDLCRLTFSYKFNDVALRYCLVGFWVKPSDKPSFVEWRFVSLPNRYAWCNEWKAVVLR